MPQWGFSEVKLPFFSLALIAIHLAQVPIITGERFRQAAREENGFRVEPESSKGGQPSWKKNAAREAWRMFNRCEMGWRVPISKYVFDTGMDFPMEIPYIAPKDIIGYMLEKHPALLVGGLENSGERASHIKSFWSAFRLTEPGHMVFREHADNLDYVLPFCLHGDEGRGKRRSKTTVFSLETPFGVMTAVNLKKRKHEDCQRNPPENIRNKYQCLDRGRAGMTDRIHTVLDGQATNTKGHSFLQHFPLFVLPGPVTEAFPTLVPALLAEISEQLRVLFFDGITSLRAAGRTFNVACIGHKGDLKWFTSIGCLARSYERQGFVQHIPCCHLCMAGSRGIEWEDFSEDPVWANTILTVTPFNPQNPSPFGRIPGCALSIENVHCYIFIWLKMFRPGKRYGFCPFN